MIGLSLLLECKISLLICAATDRGTDVVILLYLHEISKKAFSGSMLGINTVSHIETAPCYVSSFRCQLCHLDVGESRDSDPSHKGWELSHVQQPSSRTCPSAQGLCWVLCREHPLVTPLWESWRKISDILIFLFLLVFQNWKPLLPCFLVCFWFGFCLGWFWVFFFVFLWFFWFFIFALVWSLFISPCPPYHLLSVTWISSELMFSDLFFIAKTLRILTQIRKL